MHKIICNYSYVSKSIVCQEAVKGFYERWIILGLVECCCRGRTQMVSCRKDITYFHRNNPKELTISTNLCITYSHNLPSTIACLTVPTSAFKTYRLCLAISSVRSTLLI